MLSVVNYLIPSKHTVPAEVKQGHAVSSRFSAHTVNKCPFQFAFVLFVGNFAV